MSEDSTSSECGYLVGHKCEEWCYDEASAVEGESWYLECYGFATAGWHEAEGVVSAVYGADYGELYGAEGVVSPVVSEDTEEEVVVLGVGHRWLVKILRGHFGT